MTTPTANYGWGKPIVGGDLGTWGTELNIVIDAIDGQVHTQEAPNNLNINSNPSTPVVGSLTFQNVAAPSGQQTRWTLAEDVAAESGSNGGSNLSLKAYSDVGAALSTSLSFSRASGAVGVRGTQTNDNATAGNVGEFLSSLVSSAAPISLTNTIVANVTTLALSAGDWSVSGFVGITPSAGASLLLGAVSQVSATRPGNSGSAILIMTTAGLAFNEMQLAPVRFSLTAPATAYLVARADFASGTATAYGGINARRMR